MKKRISTKSAPTRSRAPARGERHAPVAVERKELKYHGANACLALWRERPEDIIRVYVEQARLPEFSELLKWVASQRKAYHLVERDDLERLTETVHHGGICVLAREREEYGFAKMRQRLRDEKGRVLLLYLDGVENPHNLGAILRACAHFGVRFVLGAAGRLPRVSASACRVAEGGAEVVDIVYLPRPLADLRLLQQDGFTLVGTTVARGRSVYDYLFPPRTILVLGSEEHGMSPQLRELTDATLRIPGTGTVESLNVASACAVFASEFFRPVKP
jgi:TrmH RNA methyltransferase